ncbi:MAG TPA: glycosyltransferase family 4 protein [Nitrospirota bacterium]|nr:glycosyltransferase family 4 protein [Nitrospirota bacterium]
MRVLFVNNFRRRGGGEEFLRDLLPGLSAKGVKIGLVCRPATPLADMFKNSQVDVFPIERTGLSGLSAFIRTANVIRKNRYEIIAIQRVHDIIQSWLGSLLSGRSPRLTYTVQVPEFVQSRILLRRVDEITTISRHIRDKIVSFDPGLASRTHIIHYGINLDQFNTASVNRGMLRERFGLSPRTRIIGTVGDLWKNQIEFLDALAIIRREMLDIRFAIVATEEGGDNEPAKAFKKRARELRLDDILLWTGRLPKDEMREFYADIDLAINMHRNEGFGIWVIEALAMGAPVISVNEGGVRDSLEGCPASILVDGGPDAVTANVLRVLSDHDLRRKMSRAGPLWVNERFNKQRMVDDYYQFYVNLTSGTRHGAPCSEQPECSHEQRDV